MSKISIEDLQSILSKQNIAPQVVQTVLKEAQEIIQEEKEDRQDSATPKQKNEFLIVVSDPMGHISSLSSDFTGWVVTMKEGDDAGTVLDRLKQAARDTNAGKKRKRNMIENMADAFRATKRAFLKSKNLMIKTKEPCRVLITDGKLQ
jgi:hypothetical protein